MLTIMAATGTATGTTPKGAATGTATGTTPKGAAITTAAATTPKGAAITTAAATTASTARVASRAPTATRMRSTLVRTLRCLPRLVGLAHIMYSKGSKTSSCRHTCTNSSLLPKGHALGLGLLPATGIDGAAALGMTYNPASTRTNAFPLSAGLSLLLSNLE
jgi:hypothetical protein